VLKFLSMCPCFQSQTHSEEIPLPPPASSLSRSCQSILHTNQSPAPSPQDPISHLCHSSRFQLQSWSLTAIVFSRSTLWLSAPGLVSKPNVGNALAFFARTYATLSISSTSTPATYTRINSLSHRNTDRPTQHPAVNYEI